MGYRGTGQPLRPRPGTRRFRGETNFGGGSEGGQFRVDGALSLVCARNRSRKLAALTPPGSSRVSPVFRSVAQSEWSSGPAHCLWLLVLCVGLRRNGAESERRKSW